MAKLMTKSLIIILVLSMSALPSTAFAQAGGVPAEEGQMELTGTRKQLATIIFSGLAGAILGLSTLSFYGRPQEKLNNIAIGAALGIFAGAAFTTYRAARAPYESYRGVDNNYFDKFTDNGIELAQANTKIYQPTIMAGWTWDF